MDIKVEDILKTFQGIKRKQILSTAQTDDFLTIIQEKKHWTMKEYKILYYALYTEYMHVPLMDHMRLHQIENKYNFTTEWSDYFYILDNIKDAQKQAQYADYYFWYHGAQLTEDIYLEFSKKPYFSKVSQESRIRFLENNIKTDNSLSWINKYFTEEELKMWLSSDNLRFHISLTEGNYTINPIKLLKVKEFYNSYEKLMKYESKVKFFNEAIQRNCLELIEFLYIEKAIRLKAKDKMKMFWHLCGDTSSSNVIEMLTELKKMGMKFTPYDLKRTKNHSQWGYMEHNDKLEHFFTMLEKEKNYECLIKKLDNGKLPGGIKQKTKKI